MVDGWCYHFVTNLHLYLPCHPHHITDHSPRGTDETADFNTNSPSSTRTSQPPTTLCTPSTSTLHTIYSLASSSLPFSPTPHSHLLLHSLPSCSAIDGTERVTCSSLHQQTSSLLLISLSLPPSHLLHINLHISNTTVSSIPTDW